MVKPLCGEICLRMFLSEGGKSFISETILFVLV